MQRRLEPQPLLLLHVACGEQSGPDAELSIWRSVRAGCADGAGEVYARRIASEECGRSVFGLPCAIVIDDVEDAEAAPAGELALLTPSNECRLRAKNQSAESVN